MSQEILTTLMDRITEEFTTGEYYKEVYSAKDEFFEKAGVVYEDDPEYEQRMRIFMDWFLFDRDLPGIDLPPIKYFLRKNRSQLPAEEIAVYENLCNTVHSIFQLKRFTLTRRHMIIEDLFSNKRYKVEDPSISQGFSRGDIFEARIIPFEGKHVYSGGFCFHPSEMEPFILAEIKKLRYQDRTRHMKLIMQLSLMKLKHMRFQHIDVGHIYTFDSKF